MNIFIREFRNSRKATIIWVVSIILFISMGMIKYSGFANMGDDVTALLDSMPKAMVTMFGLGSINLTKIDGYFSVFFVYFILLAGVHAVTLGSSILSKEQRDKTADFLIVKPIKRSSILTSKLFFSCVNMLIINFSVLVTSLLYGFIYSDKGSITIFVLQNCALLYILQLVFFSIGLFLSTLFSSSKRANGVSTIILVATYIISFVIPLNEKLEPLKYITPFSYFDVKLLLMDKNIDPIYFVLSALIIILGLTLSYIFYDKKDIHS